MHRTSSHRPLMLELLEARTLLAGSWTPLVNPAPGVIATTLLLSDGTVMAHASVEENPSRDWYQLTPDASGSYVNGSWSQLASMQNTRVYYPSQVLPDGRVLIMGGEYGNGANTAEVFDPLANSWTSTPNGPLGDIGDTPSEILPDGRVLLSYRFDGRNNIYDPVSNTWTAAATKLRNTRSDEESWVLLPDQTILTVEVFNVPHAQKYIPSENRWVDAGNLPFSLIAGSEIGPGLLLPDGRAFFIGANGRTALYTPPADPHDPGTWAGGPTIPQGLGDWDGPAAMMPNGKVLLAASPSNYGRPTTIFEFDPVTNAISQVDSPGFSGPSYEGRMLMLPSGEVLWSYSNTQLYVYTPDGDPDPSWKPTIADVTDNGDGTFLLTGTQLNGISEGAAYGDDAEMSSNYPIVRLVDGDGNVFYARTSYWSNTGVATGDALVSTTFTFPGGISPGDYSLFVVANGIASDPVDFTVGGNGPAPGHGSGKVIHPANCQGPGIFAAALAPFAKFLVGHDDGVISNRENGDHTRAAFQPMSGLNFSTMESTTAGFTQNAAGARLGLLSLSFRPENTGGAMNDVLDAFIGSILFPPNSDL
ncbi:MAG TPA: kelch repeat-containing protein [Gemmataceae bacterium]|nr:kelch repeat-containing protein [Gemmataceae bacterium]